MAAAQHCGGEAGHDLWGLHVEISVEFIRAPPADHADAVGTDAGTQKGHGPAGPGGPCGDVGRIDGGVGKDSEGVPEAPRDITCANIPRRGARGFAEGADRGLRGGLKGVEGDDTGDEAEDRADLRMAGTSVTHGLVSDPVFLSGECESRKGGGVEADDRASDVVKGPGASPQGEIAEAKQGVEVVIWDTQVFAGEKEEEET